MAQKIHPTLFRLGWTKQSQHLWYSFQKSQYGTLFLQDLLWRQSLEGAFLKIGFLISDLFIQRTSQGIIFSVQIFYSPTHSHFISSAPHSVHSTGMTSSFRQPIEKITLWQVYDLCSQFQRVLEVWTRQPVSFRIEWVPTFTESATLMAKQLRSLLEKKVSIKKALDTVFLSRKVLTEKEFPLLLPDHSYGSLMTWVWIALNSLRASHSQKYYRNWERKNGNSRVFFPFLKSISSNESWGFRCYSPQFSLRNSWKKLQWKSRSWKRSLDQNKRLSSLHKYPSFPFLLFKKKRFFLKQGQSLPSLLKDQWGFNVFQRSSKLIFPKIYRSSYLTQYWIGFLKMRLQYQFWKRESFQWPSYQPILKMDSAFQKGIQRYPFWSELSPSLLHLGDFILSSQFQIRQGRFCKYRLSGRLKGVDMAQTLKSQQGSFRDPYALQMEQIRIQTPWGTFGLSVSST